MRLRLLFAWVLLFSAVSSAEEAAYPWKAAVAKAVITPKENLWMAGYAARKSPSEGVLADIHAKALALEDADGNRALILTLDLIGVPKDLRIAVENLAEKEFGLPPANLVINASHTHCGPMIRTYRPPGGGELRASYSNIPAEENAERVAKVLSYREMLIKKIRELLEETLAEGKLQPARLDWSQSKCGFAVNRRLPSGDSWKNFPNPEGVVDHDVPVLQVRSTEGEKPLLAVMFGYACHATTLSLMEINGDWPGFAQQYFEEDHPGTIAMFLNGASADQNPYPRRILRYAQRHGMSLATSVEAAMTMKTTSVEGPIRAAISWQDIQYQTPPARAELEAQAAQSKDKYAARYASFMLEALDSGAGLPESYPVPVQVLRFGNDSLTLVTMGGEVVVDYALRMKKEFTNGPLWFAGYSNDVMTYIPSRRVLEEGGYEGGGAMRYVRSTIHPAPWETAIEEKLMAEIWRLMKATE